MSGVGIMKIITINVPDEYIYYFQYLLDMGLYPSRSEAIRVAIREFIHKEMEMGEKVIEHNNRIRQEEMNSGNKVVCIPMDRDNVKIRKIIRRLE